MKSDSDDVAKEIGDNQINGPRVLLRNGNKSKDTKIVFWIVNKQDILKQFDENDSFLTVLMYLYSFYFCLNLTYPVESEIILGFFHECLEINSPVHFDKKRTTTYSKNVEKIRIKLKA